MVTDVDERIDASFNPESGYLFAHVDPERVKAIMMECGTSVHFVLDIEHAPDPYGRRVLTAIDQLRRDLTGYHGQLKAHSDLQVHCDRQRERIADLEGLYAKAKAERDETAMAFSKEHDRAEFLMVENAKLRKELAMEREDNASIRALFEAVAPRCGKPDCPSLVEYVEQLRELVCDMWGCISHIGEYDVFYYDMTKDGCGISCTVNGEHCCADKLFDRMRGLGIEVGEWS